MKPYGDMTPKELRQELDNIHKDIKKLLHRIKALPDDSIALGVPMIITVRDFLDHVLRLSKRA